MIARRAFLKSLVGGVAVAAAVQAWPYRVYSFPSNPIGGWVSYKFSFTTTLPPVYYDKLAIMRLRDKLAFENLTSQIIIPASGKELKFFTYQTGGG